LAVEARFKAAATVAGEFFSLGDVAILTPSAPDLAGRSIYRSPSPGKTMTYNTASMRSYLEQTDEDFRGLTWSGAETVKVTRDGVTITAERISDIINRYLEKNRGKTHISNIHMEFTFTRRPKSFVLPKGKMTCRIIPADSIIYRSQSFSLTFSVDGKVEKNMSVRGKLKAVAPIAVAASDISRGTLLTGRDIQVVPLDLERLREPCFKPRQLLGQKVLRSLRKGDPIEKSMVDFPPLVKRGEIITIEAAHGGLTVTATGIARANGQEGETVRVKNRGSGKEILCKVIGPGQVAVEF
jgi:flagella basal body P-ring formation protein FlgA